MGLRKQYFGFRGSFFWVKRFFFGITPNRGFSVIWFQGRFGWINFLWDFAGIFWLTFGYKQVTSSRACRLVFPQASNDGELVGGFKYFFFHPYLAKIPNLTNMFQRGWNHQPDDAFLNSLFSKDPHIMGHSFMYIKPWQPNYGGRWRLSSGWWFYTSSYYSNFHLKQPKWLVICKVLQGIINKDPWMNLNQSGSLTECQGVGFCCVASGQMSLHAWAPSI